MSDARRHDDDHHHGENPQDNEEPAFLDPSDRRFDPVWEAALRRITHILSQLDPAAGIRRNKRPASR
jgi:hypothetical protein